MAIANKDTILAVPLRHMFCLFKASHQHNLKYKGPEMRRSMPELQKPNSGSIASPNPDNGIGQSKGLGSGLAVEVRVRGEVRVRLASQKGVSWPWLREFCSQSDYP